MKNKAFSTISPYLFEDCLVIALDKKWLEICNGIPKFTVIIDRENRLHLIGPIIQKKDARLDEWSGDPSE